MTKSRVLFLCTHNSARSQMAEGLLQNVAGDRLEAHSAGTEATFVRTHAIEVMGEVGIDISHQRSKTLELYVDEPFEYVVTVCDDANESCPFSPGRRNAFTGRWKIPLSRPVRKSSASRSSGR